MTNQLSYTERKYEDMILFMVELLPLSYDEIYRFPYQKFFRTLVIAKTEAKRKEKEYNDLKNRK